MCGIRTQLSMRRLPLTLCVVVSSFVLLCDGGRFVMYYKCGFNISNFICMQCSECLKALRMLRVLGTHTAAIVLLFAMLHAGYAFGTPAKAGGQQSEQQHTESNEQVYAFWGTAPKLGAKYAILLDYNSGIPLYEKNADAQMAPSSMTKMMTVYLVFKALKEGRISMDDTFTVSEKAWRTGGSKMFVALNASVPVSELLLGAIVQSGNDACVVLAEGLAGSEEAFADDMNKEAVELGMTNTHFCNATGLPHDGHFSTARDLATLGASLIRDFPEYYKMHSQRWFSYNGIRQNNRNSLLGKNGVDGIKTGRTDDGGYGVTTSAVINGRRLVCVVNGSSSNSERMNDSDVLLSYGFNRSNSVALFKAGEPVVSANVSYGSTLSVPLVLGDDLSVVSPYSAQGTRSESINYSMFDVKVRYTDNVAAPIVKGQILGEVVVTVGTREVKRAKLYAAHSVGTANFLQKLVQNVEKILFISTLGSSK